MYFSVSQIDPQNAWKTHNFRLLAALLEGLLERLGGGWTLDFSQCPIDPPGGGGWTLDSQKERIQVEGGGWYKVTLVLQARVLIVFRGTLI